MVQRPESPCTVPIPSRRNALSPVEPSASSEDPNYVAMGARPKWFKTGSTSGPSVSGSPAALGARPLLQCITQDDISYLKTVSFLNPQLKRT